MTRDIYHATWIICHITSFLLVQRWIHDFAGRFIKVHTRHQNWSKQGCLGNVIKVMIVSKICGKSWYFCVCANFHLTNRTANASMTAWLKKNISLCKASLGNKAGYHLYDSMMEAQNISLCQAPVRIAGRVSPWWQHDTMKTIQRRTSSSIAKLVDTSENQWDFCKPCFT